MRRSTAQSLNEFYDALLGALGPSGWWPTSESGTTPRPASNNDALEIIIGAVLTQNTAWTNVEKALNNLKAAGLLGGSATQHGPALLALHEDALAEYIRPAGFFRLKAQRLRNTLRFFEERCGFDFTLLDDESLDSLREDLLAIKGVGRETADCILLYALNKPSFVVDAYTYRILSRHGLVGEDTDYEEMRELFMAALPKDAAGLSPARTQGAAGDAVPRSESEVVQLYNEYHALIVRCAKEWCRKAKPLCAQCPLGHWLEDEPYGL